jgi:hypothetical protein
MDAEEIPIAAMDRNSDWLAVVPDRLLNKGSRHQDHMKDKKGNSALSTVVRDFFLSSDPDRTGRRTGPTC